jgi:hypothetical protein
MGPDGKDEVQCSPPRQKALQHRKDGQDESMKTQCFDSGAGVPNLNKLTSLMFFFYF